METNMKILVTGSAGFVGGYVVEELLHQGHAVVGIDNFSKYGELTKNYDTNPKYTFIQGDVKDVGLLKELIVDCDQIIAIAAMIGGISYFHTYAYDLLAENERIIASTFDAAIWAHRTKKLKKVNVVSSSMVFENTTIFPTPEGEQLKCPPPSSTYGFQKLATEYYAQGAYEQYQLPFTIIRPFNCVGIGERQARGGQTIISGNIKLALSHVVPDLIQKVLKGQNPLHLLGSGHQIRHYTYGGDLARAIGLCLENPQALNEDFNISTNQSTTVLELAQLIWEKIRPQDSFQYVIDPAYPYDVQKRVPDISKAKRLLGFEATTSLDQMLDEVIPWIDQQVQLGNI
jgi:nucleoside-diphosphate-sugar epimerase